MWPHPAAAVTTSAAPTCKQTQLCRNQLCSTQLYSTTGTGTDKSAKDGIPEVLVGKE